MEESRLYRSFTNRIIGGVAGGFGEYLNVDPLIIRIIFVVMAFVGGSGLIVYILLWIFIPEKPDHSFNTYKKMEQEKFKVENQSSAGEKKDHSKDYGKGSLIGGIILITLGVLFLIEKFFPRLDFGDLWPIILIVAGILILKNSFSNPKK
ncbi:MAG: PspC domain-containing protein [Bacteroidales bacterium]|nr:PspC domain-containing protein [Bacteroidales bacterium]